MLALILATLSIATPTSCVYSAPAWDQIIREAYASRPELARGDRVWAFYRPASMGGPRIMLGPVPCMLLRQLTRPSCDRALALEGVDTLAHEVEHAAQERRGDPWFSEEQAEDVAARKAPAWLRRLERAFGVRCRFYPVATLGS